MNNIFTKRYNIIQIRMVFSFHRQLLTDRTPVGPVVLAR